MRRPAVLRGLLFGAVFFVGLRHLQQSFCANLSPSTPPHSPLRRPPGHRGRARRVVRRSCGGERAPDDRLSRRTAGLLSSGPLLLAGGAAATEPALAASRSAEEKQATQIFREVTPSVVSIARGRRPTERRRRQSAEEEGVPLAVGSGFVWDDKHVVTNFHVLRDMGREELMVIFSDTGTSLNADTPRRDVFKGELVGADPATDTAVVRIANEPERGEAQIKVRPLARGESRTVEVGQWVYAIGNPFGLEHSMSRGIVSGIARTLEIGERPIRGCIQTDASINPGNSGGPLLDSLGRVVGVNTAILSSTGISAGVGLAVPIDTVTKQVQEILGKGFVSRAFLGITLAPDEVCEQLQLPGVIVMAVVDGSPAALAGVKPMRKGSLGDVVTALDGQTVRAGKDFFRILDNKAAGDAVVVTVQRALRGVDEGIEDIELNATLASRDGFKAPPVVQLLVPIPSVPTPPAPGPSVPAPPVPAP